MLNKSTKGKPSKKADLHQEIRHLGVLVERTDHNVSVIAEQYGDIKADIGGIKKTLDSHSAKLDSHTEMIGNLTVNLEIVKNDVEFIKQGMKRKVDAEEFSALERRVALLEKRVTQK